MNQQAPRLLQSSSKIWGRVTQRALVMVAASVAPRMDRLFRSDHAALKFIALAAALIAQTDLADAMCPSPGYYAAKGAVSLTGRVVRQGPTTSAGPFPSWVEVQVTRDASGRFAGKTVRVHTPEMAMYTASFRLGETYDMSVLIGADGLSTSACMMRR